MAKLSKYSHSEWLLLFLVLFSLPLLTAAKHWVHNFEGRCEVCHLSVTAGKLSFTRDIDFLCRSCHGELGFSHPSGAKPSFRLPVLFPLDSAGRMTCVTCHDVHGAETYLLRGGTAGKVFCHSCHEGTSGSHWSAGQPAHSISDDDDSENGFYVTNRGVPIDRVSLECIGCHDSTVANNVATKIRSGIWFGRMGGSHPIGVYYMDAYRKGGYHPPSTINPAVRLYNGRVGCGSCHNIFSREKYYLTVGNDRHSRLCTSCHNK